MVRFVTILGEGTTTLKIITNGWVEFNPLLPQVPFEASRGDADC